MQDALELLAVANAHQDRIMQRQSITPHPTPQHESTSGNHAPSSVNKALSTSQPALNRVTNEGSGETGSGEQGTSGDIPGHEDVTKDILGHVSWAGPFLRPAANARQAATFSRLSAQSPGNPPAPSQAAECALTAGARSICLYARHACLSERMLYSCTNVSSHDVSHAHVHCTEYP